ncbi:ferredoxin [Nocardia sp. NPDC052278]|uniref:ferredoxin n=1 Tax=unclassified Nocardia TaxID=2637762 RepID=UPI0036B75C0B
MTTDDVWTIEVKRDLCVGNRMCVASAPDVFEITDGKSRARSAYWSASPALVDAFESCPVSAIVLRDETGAEFESEP